MTGDVIKSFLVGLGFGVDDASLSKFNKAIASATLKVSALYASTKIAAAGIALGISKISEGFEQMGYEYRIIAPAINKALMLRRELLKAYSAAGINITKVIQSSVKLNFSLAKTKFAFEAIYKSVASRFFDLLTKQSDIFRKRLYDNLPKIQSVLERMIKFVFKAFEATVALGERLWSVLTRVYDFFVALDKATDGWSTIVLGLVAAWELLNLSFLATPLGMILTGLVAILALYDDFKTFTEGGKSLFDWSYALPIINAISSALGKMYDYLQKVVGYVEDVVLDVFFKLTQTLKSIASTGDAIATALAPWLAPLFGNPNVAANLASAAKGMPTAAPVGGNVQNSSTNQNVQQQTSINVIGSADASAVGKAVAGEQGKVNFDMVRNMKGATR